MKTQPAADKRPPAWPIWGKRCSQCGQDPQVPASFQPLICMQPLSLLAKKVSSRINNCVASSYEEEAAHLISEASLWEYQCEFHFQSNKNSFVNTLHSQLGPHKPANAPTVAIPYTTHTLHIHKAACQGGQRWEVQPSRVIKFFGVELFKHTPEVSTMSAAVILLIHAQNNKKN